MSAYLCKGHDHHQTIIFTSKRNCSQWPQRCLGSQPPKASGTQVLQTSLRINSSLAVGLVFSFPVFSPEPMARLQESIDVEPPPAVKSLRSKVEQLALDVNKRPPP